MSTLIESPPTKVKPSSDGVRKASCTMAGFKLQVMVALTVVCALLYMIFSYFQDNQLLATKLQQLHLKYNRAQTQRKTFETKYETSHSNEEMFQMSNRQLKVNLARTNKQLAETVGELNSFKTKFTYAHLFYKDMKDMLDVPDEVGDGEKEKKVEPNIVSLIKHKLDQWKTRLRMLEDLQRNQTKLTHLYRSLKIAHAAAQEKLIRLQETNAKMAEEKVKSTKVYDTLAQNYKNLTALYTKHADVNKKLRQKLKDFRVSIVQMQSATISTKGGGVPAVLGPLTSKSATSNIFPTAATRGHVGGQRTVRANKSESNLSTSFEHVAHKLKNMASNILLPSPRKKNIDVKEEETKIKPQVTGDNAFIDGHGMKHIGARSLDEEPKFDPEHTNDPIDANGLGTKVN